MLLPLGEVEFKISFLENVNFEEDGLCLSTIGFIIVLC